MVRVISVHHFTHQDVMALDNSGGNGVARGNNDILFIGGEHKIEIRNLKENSIIGSFPTVDLVKQLSYCRKGDYVCTLETKTARQGLDHSYARVYLNWDVENGEQPMQARIAGKVTPSSQTDADCLEMVEISMNKPAEYTSCCQTTGNIAIASGMSISIFKYCHKFHEHSKVKFVDFDEMIDIDIAFVAKEVFIAEDIIGCVSELEAHVFQIVINAELLKSSDAKETSLNIVNKVSEKNEKCRSNSRSPGRSSESSMSQFRGKKILQNEPSIQVIRDSSEFVDLSEMKWVPTLSYCKKSSNFNDDFLLFPSLVGASHCDRLTKMGETLGPISASQCSNVRIKILSGNKSNKNTSVGIFDAVTLLHRRTDSVLEPDLPFSNLQISCIYGKLTDSGVVSPITSARNSFPHPLLPHGVEKYSAKTGATLFMTTPHTGFLYHVTFEENNEDHKVVRGGTFSYTSPVSTVALEVCLLHALTLTGLETYTMRLHPCLVEGLMETEQKFIVPSQWEESNCLVGLRPFLNVDTLTLTDSCLALIASNDEGGSQNHTCYSLHLPSLASLYHEMVRVGLSHKLTSPQTYLHLLLEAHFVLIAAMREWLQMPQDASRNKENIHSLLNESKMMLGDYYASCDCEQEWDQAIQFYESSSLGPTGILERLNEETPGLVYIITSVLLNPKTKVLSELQANIILDFLEKNVPGVISKLLLKSLCIKDYKKEKILAVLKSELSKNSADPCPRTILCLALVIMEKGSPDQVSTVLSLLRVHQLVEIILEHSKFLFEHSQNQIRLSPLALILASHKYEVFLEAFVLLIGKGTLSLDAFVSAYIGSFPIVSCGIECNANSLKLIDVIEYFFREFGHLNELTDQPEKYKQTISVLVGLYIASLIGAFDSDSQNEKERRERRASWINLYAERPSYLNYFPPFNGETLKTECLKIATEENVNVVNVVCCCRQCCLHLLLMQSLFASSLASSNDIASVLHFVNSNSTLIGAASLKVLCLDSKQQREFIVDYHPNALLQYCKDTYDSPYEWENAIQLLIARKKQYSMEDPKYEKIDQVLNGVLNELLMNSSFPTFVDLIPVDVQDSYKSHIRQSHLSGLAQYLKDSLVIYADGVLLKQKVEGGN